MRVLLVNDTARIHTGGANRVVVETLGLLAAAGHQPALAYCDGGPNELGCPVFTFGRNASPAAGQSEWRKLLRAFAPEVVQLHWSDHPYLRRLIAEEVPTCRFIHDQSWFCSGGDRMARDYIPCHRPHGWACLFWHYAQGCGGRHPVGNWNRWRRVGAHQSALRSSRLRLQVASEFMRVGLIENGYSAERIDLIPLYALAAAAGESVEPGLLLVACRLVRGKGLDLLISALAELPANGWRLVVAGTGPQRTEIESRVARRGLRELVSFLGEIAPEQLAQWYSRAAVVVHPTVRPEPFGLVGPEAMAHGKPVVAFSGGATAEWLADGETGILVPERTPKALAAALARLLAHPEQASALGAQGRRAWERFRPERYLRHLVDSFERCRREFAARPS